MLFLLLPERQPLPNHRAKHSSSRHEEEIFIGCCLYFRIKVYGVRTVYMTKPSLPEVVFVATCDVRLSTTKQPFDKLLDCAGSRSYLCLPAGPLLREREQEAKNEERYRSCKMHVMNHVCRIKILHGNAYRRPFRPAG